MASEKQQWFRVISAVLDGTQKGPDGRLVQEQGAKFRCLEIGCGITAEIEVSTEIYFWSQQADNRIFFGSQAEMSLANLSIGDSAREMWTHWCVIPGDMYSVRYLLDERVECTIRGVRRKYMGHLCLLY